MTSKMFPIQNGPDVPWSLMEAARGQAMRNHGQTLERLAERGGLSCYEAVCALEAERLTTDVHAGKDDAFFRRRLAEYVETDQTLRIADLERERDELRRKLERRTEALRCYANESNWSQSEYRTREGLTHRLLDRFAMTGVFHGPTLAQDALADEGEDDEQR